MSKRKWIVCFSVPVIVQLIITLFFAIDSDKFAALLFLASMLIAPVAYMIATTVLLSNEPKQSQKDFWMKIFISLTSLFVLIYLYDIIVLLWALIRSREYNLISVGDFAFNPFYIPVIASVLLITVSFISNVTKQKKEKTNS